VELVIECRFCGPSESANGGYTCGLLAAVVGEPAEVTLRRSPALDKPLHVERRGDEEAVLLDGDMLVAEARRAELDLDVPAPVSFADAEAAVARFSGFDRHAFPQCFVCGPARAHGDGLRIFAGKVSGRDLVAAPWVPDEALAGPDGLVRREVVWAALDCPGAFAVGFSSRGETMLGRLTGEVLAPVRTGEPYVAMGWALGQEGRKLYAGTALTTAAGELCGRAWATWIMPA
jgi:hypothetical protein